MIFISFHLASSRAAGCAAPVANSKKEIILSITNSLNTYGKRTFWSYIISKWFYFFIIFSVIRQNGKSQNGVTRKQSTPNIPKNEHFLPLILIRVHTCAYQWVKVVRVSENLACFAFLLSPRFVLLPYYQRTRLLSIIWTFRINILFISIGVSYVMLRFAINDAFCNKTFCACWLRT